MNKDPNPVAEEIQFSQLDKIIEIVAGERITAVKNLSGDEEYLGDHFPGFPVMPGVLMLEAMFQAASWLIRYTNQFSHSIVELREARNIKFQNFVTPGNQLQVQATILKQDDHLYTLKTEGRLEPGVAVSGRLVVESYNRNERCPSTVPVDEAVILEKKRDFALLYSGS